MGVALINGNDKRVKRVDEAIWKAVIHQAEIKKDEFPFTAKDVSREIGKEKSNAMITRNRGGLTNMLLQKRESFLTELKKLVEEESNNTGEISLAFCRRLGFLVSEYRMLFSIDIVRDSHRNSKLLLEPLRELIHKNKYPLFILGFYVMLKEWYQDNRFTREAVLGKYERRLQELFNKYQIVRPDMSVTIGGKNHGK